MRLAATRAYLVHGLTASGVGFAFLAAAELTAREPDPRRVFLWLAIAVVIDSIDGPLARKWDVKRWAARIDGRKIDDLVDYLTFTFVPLLLVWRMGWLPAPAGLWVVPAMMASLLAFANVGAKEDEAGFFLGFPSYWNVFALYAGVIATAWGPWVNAGLMVLLTVLTIVPMRFVYPNRSGRPWRELLTVGAVAWLVLVLAAVLPTYPDAPAWAMWLSLAYPAFYVAISIRLDVADRRRRYSDGGR